MAGYFAEDEIDLTIRCASDMPNDTLIVSFSRDDDEIAFLVVNETTDHAQINLTPATARQLGEALTRWADNPVPPESDADLLRRVAASGYAGPPEQDRFLALADRLEAS